MAIGDETQAGARPSLPPRRPPGLGDDPSTRATQRMGADRPLEDDRFPALPYPQPASQTQPRPQQGGAPRPQILAPQATEWETNMQEVEVVKSRRTGLVVLFLFALLAVAVVALGLAALSVLRGGDEAAGDGTEAGTEAGTDAGSEVGTEGGVGSAAGVETGTGSAGDLGGDLGENGGAAGSGSESDDTLGATVPPLPGPNELGLVLTENPFVCDGGTRPFAQLTGAAANEQVTFSSPQSGNLRNGEADAAGALPIRWQCDPDQAGTTWELTATGVTSGKTVTFIFAGVTAPETATTAAPASTSLTVDLVENPFVCDGGTRVFGQLAGADPNERVAFSSPQASNISPGTAGADGTLSIRWQCDPEQAGTRWELTATGVLSQRTVTFSFTGS